MSLRTSLSGIVAGHDLKVAERTVRRTSLRTPDETKRTGVRIRSFDKDGNRNTFTWGDLSIRWAEPGALWGGEFL